MSWRDSSSLTSRFYIYMILKYDFILLEWFIKSSMSKILDNFISVVKLIFYSGIIPCPKVHYHRTCFMPSNRQKRMKIIKIKCKLEIVQRF